jgi:cytoskeletal protein RodZ
MSNFLSDLVEFLVNGIVHFSGRNTDDPFIYLFAFVLVVLLLAVTILIIIAALGAFLRSRDSKSQAQEPLSSQVVGQKSQVDVSTSQNTQEEISPTTQSIQPESR